MPEGSILFSSRAPIGYVAIAANKIATNQGFKNLVPNTDLVYNEFVYYYLKFAKRIAEEFASGTTFKEISSTGFSRIPIPVPPLDEQQHIVSKIEELFSELDKGIESLQKTKVQLKAYKDSIISQLPIEENKPLSTIVKVLYQGWSPKCERQPSLSSETWGVIKTTAIQPFTFKEFENKQLPKTLEPRKNLEILGGDLLITRAGPRKRVGVICLVRRTRSKLILCDKAYGIRLDHKKALPDYIELVLNSPQIRNRLDEIKTGISESGVNLTQKGFLSLELPIPSLRKQGEIVIELESKLSVCDHMEESIDEQLLQAEALRQSILKKAFEGRLV
jgi:type I restriction enzyme S subunit